MSTMSTRQPRLLVLTWLTMMAVTTIGTTVSAAEPGIGCEGGACPSPFVAMDDSTGEPSVSAVLPSSDKDCGMWLGPSQIKKAEFHGFGLGVFTGRAIKKGTAIEPLYNGAHGNVGEPLLPYWGAETLYEEHPPLREYVWDEDNMPEVAVVYPAGLTALFAPGLAALAPCTGVNFNLRVLGPGKQNGQRDSVYEQVLPHNNNHRNHVQNGAYATRHNVTYVAVRDISPGEELTVECSDDDYDGGAYYLSTFQPDQDDAVVCLDEYVQVQESPRIDQGQYGLFAKRNIDVNTTIVSSPVLPIHRDLMEMDDIEGLSLSALQLMLNYCYGHASSDLLWLPYGPLISYLNHSPTPNARLRWHDKISLDNSQQDQQTHARQQHHHAELLALPAHVVSKIHGKSLTLDVVALRPISPGEEVTIDYGSTWSDAFERHVRASKAKSLIASPSLHVVSAEDYNQRHAGDYYKTQVEQLRNPYPDNLELFCFYSLQERFMDKNVHRHVVEFDANNDDDVHECFRPCQVLERTSSSEVDEQQYFYTVQLSASDDDRIVSHCILDNHDEIWTHVPHRAIRLVDRPYTTPVFHVDAFRHEIGLPLDMIPPIWFRKKLRGATMNNATALGEEFKRKKNVEVTVKGSTRTSSSASSSATNTRLLIL